MPEQAYEPAPSPDQRPNWIPQLVSLVAMNYHFVSDVIAGSVLGAIVAAYAARLAMLAGSRGDST